MSTTVSIGLGLSRTPPTRRRFEKGISANRRAYDARRRLSQRSEETLTYMRLLRYDPCILCGERPAEGGVQDVDHITPLSLGGLDTWENMAAACASCNRGRRDRSLLESLLRRGERHARRR